MSSSVIVYDKKKFIDKISLDQDEQDTNILTVTLSKQILHNKYGVNFIINFNMINDDGKSEELLHVVKSEVSKTEISTDYYYHDSKDKVISEGKREINSSECTELEKPQEEKKSITLKDTIPELTTEEIKYNLSFFPDEKKGQEKIPGITSDQKDDIDLMDKLSPEELKYNLSMFNKEERAQRAASVSESKEKRLDFTSGLTPILPEEKSIVSNNSSDIKLITKELNPDEKIIVSSLSDHLSNNIVDLIIPFVKELTDEELWEIEVKKSEDRNITENSLPEPEGKFYSFLCPQCRYYTSVRKDSVNCKIFRHMSVKTYDLPPGANPNQQLNMHSDKPTCDRLLESGIINGCAKPFWFDGTVVKKCKYI